MLNIITIHGRLTADPELRQTPSGVNVCSFTVAVDRSYSKGEDKITDFFNCTAWRGLADTISTYFTKGREIVVQGAMQSEKYKDKDGNDRIAWKLVANSVDFCGTKTNNASLTIAPPATQQTNTISGLDDFKNVASSEGDLPF